LQDQSEHQEARQQNDVKKIKKGRKLISYDSLGGQHWNPATALINAIDTSGIGGVWHGRCHEFWIVLGIARFAERALNSPRKIRITEGFLKYDGAGFGGKYRRRVAADEDVGNKAAAQYLVDRR